ncbi:MAG: hypothetical protein AAB358_03235 [Patescibacteria group bacterium]
MEDKTMRSKRFLTITLAMLILVAFLMPVAMAKEAKAPAKQEAKAEKGGGADNVVKSFFTLVGRPLLAPFFAIKNVVDNGGTPLRWVNSAVRSVREDVFDAPVDAAKFLASPFGVEPTPLDDVGELNQAIRDAGPVAEAIADGVFVGAVVGVAQNNHRALFGAGHLNHKWEKAVMVGAGASLGSQALDPTSSNSNSDRPKGVLGKLVRHGTEARRVVEKN